MAEAETHFLKPTRYLVGALALFALSAYWMMQKNAHGPPFHVAPIAYYGAYILLIPFLTPFVILGFLITYAASQAISALAPIAVDIVLCLVLFGSFILFQLYLWPGFYAPFLWALLLVKVPYQTLRSSLLFLTLLSWAAVP